MRFLIPIVSVINGIIEMVKHKILPIPHANVDEVLGLADALYAYRGKAKLSFLADELQIEIDDLGEAVDMAKLLGMLKIKSGTLLLTLFGEALSIGNTDNKKKILREKMIKVEPFKTIIQLLRKSGGKMEKDELLEALSTKFVIEDKESFFKIILGWGNYTESFEYDSDEQLFLLSKSLL